MCLLVPEQMLKTVKVWCEDEISLCFNEAAVTSSFNFKLKVTNFGLLLSFDGDFDLRVFQGNVEGFKEDTVEHLHGAGSICDDLFRAGEVHSKFQVFGARTRG